MSENWDVYFGYIEDRMASIVLDMDITEEVNTEEYHHPYCIRFKVKRPNEDGFPIGAEADRLGDIEDSLIDSLDTHHFVHVGRVTTDGIRDLIFYSNQKEQDALVDAAERFSQPAGYEVEVFRIEEDEPWEFYYDILYPNQYQQQHMGNRHVVERLEESGDTLQVPRKVDHWVYFDHPKSMKRFTKAIKKEGFSIESETGHPNEEGKYVLTISRVDLVDLPSINEVTDLLVEISETYDGEYDGWETLVIES
ncbi:DUF695 domain-containing protein [Rossellomorea sp. NRS-1567]|uniref:DUF695 domain-containing protein n=1 Tax=Rossellomorea sp. NRS-1567 TaxID=3233901 RepID=UPI003D28B03A